MAEGSAAKKIEPVQNETAAAIQSLADAMHARAPKTPLEMAGLDEDRIRTLTTAGAAKRYRLIAGKSDDTGATFVLHVVESKEMPNGRIVALQSYKHPVGMLIEERNGGRLPNGFPALRTTDPINIPEGQEVPRHMLTIKYLHWRWQNFWLVDLKRLVGKELRAHHCAQDDGLKTPWVAGKVALVPPSE